MAEKKEHDVDYSDPAEEQKGNWEKKVLCSFLLNITYNWSLIGWSSRSYQGYRRRARRMHFQDESKALQNPRWTMERERNWKLQNHETQRDQEGQSYHETRENSQASCQLHQ